MILIGLGANLASHRGGPRETLEQALSALEDRGIAVLQRSRWYESAPVPPSDQPWFVNGVAALRTALDPAALLGQLHAVEAAFGRERRAIDEARVLDLDLLDYDGQIRAVPPLLPHPRLAGRAFVLRPLAEVAPGWRHPATGRSIAALLHDLEPAQIARPI